MRRMDSDRLRGESKDERLKAKRLLLFCRRFVVVVSAVTFLKLYLHFK